MLPVKSEIVQRNLQRMQQMTNLAATNMAASATAAAQAAEPVYRSSAQTAGASNPEETMDMPYLDDAMRQASEEVRSAMQQAQNSIESAEALARNSELVFEEQVMQAQRIAERAVAEAISSSEGALKGAMQGTPASPEVQSPNPGGRSEVQ